MRGYWLLIGFLLLFVGFLQMILDIMGLQFTFMWWLTSLSGLTRALIYLLMCFGGVAIMYFNSIDWKNDPEAPIEIAQKKNED